jgi:predicted DNA-binding transcriptional regulator AlpA
MAQITDQAIEKLMTRQQVVHMSGLSLPGLLKMEREGRGPVVLRLGRRVMYRPSDIAAWLDSCASRGTQSAEA